MRRRLAALALAVVLPVLPLPGRADVVVRPGETLSEIAERYGVSLSRLMQANGISNPEFVEAGRRLVIPGQSSRASGSGGSGAGGGSVVVQPGDTLSEIAERHGLSLQRLMQLNGISDPSLVEAGRRLVLTAGSSAGPASGRAGGSGSRAGSGGSHTVQSGETLSEIAERYGTSTSRLMALNGISNADLVVSGTRLTLPDRPGTTPAKAAGSERPAYDRSAKVHVVRPGESLSQIAAGYRIPLERLVALNSLSDPDHLTSGTRLKLVGSPAAPRPAAAKPATTKPTAKPTTTATASKPASSQPAAAKPTTTAKPATAAKPAAAAQPATAGAEPAPAQPAASQPRPTTATATPATAAAAAPSAATSSSTATAAAKPAPRPAASSTSPTPTAAKPTTSATGRTTPSAATATATSTTAASTPAAKTTAPKTTAAQTTAARSATAKPTTAGTAKAATTKATTAKATTAKATTAKAQPSKPDWRTYGPLQVDWANWQSMGGSYVAPSLSGDGQPLYTAVNCSARKLNSTSQNGQWKTWEAPRNDSEQQLVSDLCKAKGG